MIGRTTCGFRVNALKPKVEQIELFNERVDHPNRIVRVDPIFKIFRE